MKQVHFFSFFMLLLSVNAFSQSPQELARALDTLVPTLMQNQSVAFGSLTYGDTELGSSFSRHLEERLSLAIPRSTKLRLIQRGAIRNMDPSFREVYAEHFESQTPDALLSGTFVPEGRTIMVKLQLVSLFTAELLGAVEIPFALNTIPPGLTVAPPNLQSAQRLQTELETVVSRPAGNLTLNVTTTRGDGAVFMDGEEMELLVMASQDAFVNIYHIGIDGEIQLIFPNLFQTTARVRAGELVKIPGAGWPFTFELHAPFGVEHIKVLASTEPFPDVPSFHSLGRDPGRILTRGLSVRRASTTQDAEAEVSYSIVPRQEGGR